MVVYIVSLNCSDYLIHRRSIHYCLPVKSLSLIERENASSFLLPGSWLWTCRTNGNRKSQGKAVGARQAFLPSTLLEGGSRFCDGRTQEWSGWHWALSRGKLPHYWKLLVIGKASGLATLFLSWLYIFSSTKSALEIEPRTSHMLGNRSTMDPLTPHSAPGKLVFFFFFFFLCQAKHLHKISFANNPNFPTWETEAGGSDDITQLWLYRKFQASQGYIRSCRGIGVRVEELGEDDHAITIKNRLMTWQ